MVDDANDTSNEARLLNDNTSPLRVSVKEDTAILRKPNGKFNGETVALSLGDNPKKVDFIVNRKTINLTHVPKRPPVDIEFKKLSYTVSEGKKGKKVILKELDGKIKCGELTAIMGPSGAGKSSLMNILAGYRISNVSGAVLINDKKRNPSKFRKMSCYIMQDDCLSPLLTVKEAMNISVKLKLGKDCSEDLKKNVITDILEALGLSDCVTTRTSSLSGGQRKRLSIALELVNNPPVMFFDEPTSGLDSSSCFQCICLLKSLARGGRTVICTIHQPSARLFEMFDHLYMLVDGHCMYKGEVLSLVPFLSSMGLHCPSYHNPADYAMEVASGDHGDCISTIVEAVKQGTCSKFRKQLSVEPTANSRESSNKDFSVSEVPAGTADDNISKSSNAEDNSNCNSSLLGSKEHLSTFPTSSLQQFVILLKRTFISTFRDPQLTRLRLLAHVSVGALLGALYWDIGNNAAKIQSNVGCIFFMMFFTLFASMMPTILTFPAERPVFRKEHMNYWYSLKSYYFAKTCSDIPFQVLMTSAFVLVVYFMTSQPVDVWRVLMFLNINILTSLIAQSIGLIVGTAFDVETGTFMGPITTIPLILFSGFFISMGDIPWFLRWLTYVSFMRYSFEGCMIPIFGLNREKLECNEAYCHFKYPDRFLESITISGDMHTYITDVLVLLFFFVIARVALYFLLRIQVRMNR